VQSGKNEPRLTRYERDFAAFTTHCDVEVLALEIEHRLEAGLREALDHRQVVLERLLEAHPATVAERERWRSNRAEYEARMAKFKKRDEIIPADVAARLLARRWGLTLAG